MEQERQRQGRTRRKEQARRWLWVVWKLSAIQEECQAEAAENQTFALHRRAIVSCESNQSGRRSGVAAATASKLTRLPP
jgi:hypothetical protein